jgi:hypothetical protein
MSDERFPYLKNFLKPTRVGSAISDKTPGSTVSALLALNELGVPEKISPTEIVLITSSGKKFRFHCSSETKSDEPPINFDEVHRVLEDAAAAAEERAAILEFDAGLQRQEADEKARGLHIQPVIDDLLRRGFVSIEGEVPGEHMSTPPSAKPVAKLQPVEAPQTSPPAGILTCVACPWYELNPWTHDPALGAWCLYRMEGLVLGSPVCEEFNRGEVPTRQNYEPATQVQLSVSPASQEGVLTCADCPHFEPNRGPTPGKDGGSVSGVDGADTEAQRRARRHWTLRGIMNWNR